MQTKLTLRVEERLVVRAKTWARRRGVSLSETVAAILDQLPGTGEQRLSPWTEALVGIAGRKRALSDANVKRAHLDHLQKKHR